MKKPTKKLTISGETIRKLGVHDLANANGGTSTLTLLCPPTQPQTQCLHHSVACEY